MLHHAAHPYNCEAKFLGHLTMLKKTIFYLTCLVSTLSASSKNQELIRLEGVNIGWFSMFTLPEEHIDNHFDLVKNEVEKRWLMLGASCDFPAYSPGRSEDSIVEEFYELNDLRVQIWFQNHTAFPCQSNPLFKISQKHLQTNRFRQPNCITFEHSATDSSYNSSSIAIGKRRFFALEGPLEEYVPYFFRLLCNWKVSFLVCLTNEIDRKGTPKCYPYWQNRIVQRDEGQFLRIKVEGFREQPDSWDTVDIPYVFWPDWIDNQGVEPKRLIKEANLVRANTKNEDIIAVHCSAGVGRTGTFIATICLLDEIDKQLENGIKPADVHINIAQLFLYLNHYRPWLVTQPSQYVTLYRTVEYYLKEQ